MKNPAARRKRVASMLDRQTYGYRLQPLACWLLGHEPIPAASWYVGSKGTACAFCLKRLAGGGRVAHRGPRGDEMAALLSEGKLITDPNEAEALGLNVDAARLRRDSGDDGSAA